jgi:hypothetical protein
VSEVRHQLPAGQRIEHKTSHEGVNGSWYRLVVEPGQLTLPTSFKCAPRCIVAPGVYFR